MNVQEFDKRAECIVEDELKNIKNMVKKIPDSKAKEEADQLGLDTIDTDIESGHIMTFCVGYKTAMIKS
jgi:hypothetical protein